MADKLLVLQRLLWSCFFSVFTVVVGNVVLLGVPQARETLYALGDGSPDTPVREFLRFVLFAAAYLYWAFTAWFVARLMLGREFPPSSAAPPGRHKLARFENASARIIPRALGLLATVPLALAMLAVWPVYSWLLMALAGVFLLFVWGRHRFSFFKNANPEREFSDYAFFQRMPNSSRWALAGFFAVSWGVFVAVWVAPVQAGRFIGSPALLLVALGSWTLVGSMVLSYWPKTRKWPSLGWVPVLLVLVFSSRDNHPVAPQRDSTPTEDWRARRPALEPHFDDWMHAHKRGEPVYMVAVAGGASRAAYWSGMTLARLEDEARHSGKRFGENLFMLSSVSGGSLGAAAFVGGLAAWPARPSPVSPTPVSSTQGIQPQVSPPQISQALDQLLGQDLLAPTVGMLLYPDLLQRFFPVVDVLRTADRSYALEHAWSTDWKDIVATQGSSARGAAGWWEAPLVAPYAQHPQLPALLLNTVRLEDGQRMVQSNLKFDLPEVQDLLAPEFDTHHLTLAGAVHNSARFPYISPAGRVRLVAAPGETDKPVWGHLGDGGYHEASGAATLADVIERLLASGRMRRGTDGLQACTGTGTQALCDSPVVLVLIDNQPEPWGPGWRHDLQGGLRTQDALWLRKSWPVPELSAPAQGLVSAWTSNSTRAEWRLARLAGTGAGRYVELRFPLYAVRRQPSMNWHLDAASRKLLREATAPAQLAPQPTRNLADLALALNLARLRAWITRSAI